MKKTLYFLLTFALSANLYASDLNGIKAADITDLNALDLPVPAAAETSPEQTTGKGYQNVWMTVRSNPSWGQAEAGDYSAGIEASVSKVFDGQYNVTLRTGTQSEWGSIQKILDKDLQFSGSGMYLKMSEWGGNYNIAGNVVGPESQNKYVNFTLYRRFDETSFSLNGGDIDLTIDKNSINGNYDDRQYSKKGIAAIVSLALAVQIDKATPITP